eukprot:5817623-Pyramimonas_sp.AAC.1
MLSRLGKSLLSTPKCTGAPETPHAEAGDVDWSDEMKIWLECEKDGWKVPTDGNTSPLASRWQRPCGTNVFVAVGS